MIIDRQLQFALKKARNLVLRLPPNKREQYQKKLVSLSQQAEAAFRVILKKEQK